MTATKKLLFFSAFFIFVFVAFPSCSQNKDTTAFGVVSQSKIKQKQANQAKKEQNQVSMIAPDIQKLNSVLLSLSPRAKEAIPNGNPKEFLSDLYSVLKQKSDTQDISLYHLIDKKHNIGKDYVPKNLVPLKSNAAYNVNRQDLSLRKEAADSLYIMAQEAKKQGITLLVSSTYRSYSYQQNLFAHWVQIDGLEEATRESARAGESQHQLGTAIDFGSITDDFADTKMGKWLYANAGLFGFSLSFPKEYEDVTGYRFECWHFRYIGKQAVDFCDKWFSGVQQFCLEFIDLWQKT